jgi:hypothetical protein
MPREEVVAVVVGLMANDAYGVRRVLTVVLAEADVR